jgi:hypothetical protein
MVVDMDEPDVLACVHASTASALEQAASKITDAIPTLPWDTAADYGAPRVGRGPWAKSIRWPDLGVSHSRSVGVRLAVEL